MIRLVHLLKRRADQAASEFAHRWRDDHGPRVAAQQVSLGILRYSQLHRDPDSAELERGARAKRGGMAGEYDGVAEYWFESEEALSALLSGATGGRALAGLVESMSEFVDLRTSPLWFAHEYPQVSTRRERVVARPKTGIIKVHFPLCPPPGWSAAEGQLYWRTRHGPLIRSHAAARGSLCYQQVHRCESPLEVALCDAFGTPASSYMGHAEAWFDRLVTQVGFEAAAAEAAALADEQRFIDWSASTFLIGKELVFVDRDWI